MRNFHVRLQMAADEDLPRLLHAAHRWAQREERRRGLVVWEFAWAAFGEMVERDEREFFS